VAGSVSKDGLRADLEALRSKPENAKHQKQLGDAIRWVRNCIIVLGATVIRGPRDAA
jgi:hypothetical protein